MVFEKVAALIAEKIDVDVSEIKPETQFEDLSIDSLDITEIAMSIEDEFEIEFEASPDMKTVAELVAAVEAKVG
ncbi:MAG: acyl carrier protein [Clostridia bacterium]|nr:acyl carrier protein [Clostridia bacterium]